MLIFFFNDTATTEIYTLSLHDALPISRTADGVLLDLNGNQDVEAVLTGLTPGTTYRVRIVAANGAGSSAGAEVVLDRKSTRLNSSHANISYAVFCLKKKKLNTPSSVES